MWLFGELMEVITDTKLSSVYTITYWLSVHLPYGDILHSLTYAGIS